MPSDADQPKDPTAEKQLRELMDNLAVPDAKMVDAAKQLARMPELSRYVHPTPEQAKELVTRVATYEKTYRETALRGKRAFEAYKQAQRDIQLQAEAYKQVQRDAQLQVEAQARELARIRQEEVDQWQRRHNVLIDFIKQANQEMLSVQSITGTRPEDFQGQISRWLSSGHASEIIKQLPREDERLEPDPVTGYLEGTIPFEELPEHLRESATELREFVYSIGISIAVLMLFMLKILILFSEKTVQAGSELAEILVLVMIVLKDMVDKRK